MNKIYQILLFGVLLTHIISCCEEPVDVMSVAAKSKGYKTNIVGIAGQASTEPYIEIIYSVANGTEGNITKSVMVSPPYIFENNSVNIVYDSLTYVMGNRFLYYQLMLKHDYGEGGAEYFRIINHSVDKPIEFFFAGTQDVVTEPSGGIMELVVFLPGVYYKKAPIYYLLFPEKKYKHNLSWGSDMKDIFYFEGNRCGDIELTSAWSVEDVMKLYRAEYRHSPDTILYVDTRAALDGSRMTEPPKYSDHRLKDKIFYGIIRPGEELKGNPSIGLLATPWIFDDVIESSR
ncbi:hypothetical protein AGMMS49982_12730 [Bacteroidia bacterium]|nr:hypothetical protein AGMMS49982_12730 [Bacteroidia bacterium]